MSDTETTTLTLTARQAYQQGDFENAARLFGQAAAALQAGNMPLEAAEMKNNQSVAWLQNKNARAAFEAADGSPAVFAAAGDHRREGLAWGNRASALNALGRLNEAFADYTAAAAALEKAGEDQLRADVLQAAAGIQLRQGQMMKALATMQVGLAGVKHPTLKQTILRALLRFRSW